MPKISVTKENINQIVHAHDEYWDRPQVRTIQIQACIRNQILV
jgi:hypothetical protein